jgi:hypothetical protein
VAVDRSLFQRARGAAVLDATVFAEVEGDPTATRQALAIVVLGALARTVGASRTGVVELGGGALQGVAGWFLFTVLAWFVGVRLFGGEGSWGASIRPLGFAQAPAAFGLFALLPRVGWLVETLVVLWILGASAVALREALGLAQEQAVVTAVAAGAVWGLCSLVV